ncbi:uracil-DNA glycosylase [Candidatus Woesearchaeota archaeon]|nr:uracil-DNA glycosylase [Candidatus Woesearchaeota archaeon]
MTFDELKQEYSKCTACPELCKSRTQVVFGSGNPEAKVLFIGEAPGATEDKQGISFCGMSGKILDELLATISLSREDVFVTNTILCRPKDNRNPAPEEIENCRKRLDQLIAIMQPKVIVTVGNFATERITGKKGIKSLRGKVIDLKLEVKDHSKLDLNDKKQEIKVNQDIKVVPIIHPANFLYNGRNPKLWEEMKQDFLVIASVIEKQIPEQIEIKQTKEQKSLSEF